MITATIPHVVTSYAARSRFGICRTCDVRWRWWGAPASFRAARCPKCGAGLQRTTGHASGLWRWAAIAVVDGKRQIALLPRDHFQPEGAPKTVRVAGIRHKIAGWWWQKTTKEKP